MPTIKLDELIPGAIKVDPVIFDHLCLPPYHGPPDHDDIAPLLSLVKYCQPKVILEIGTAHGATVANICAISQARVFTVNALPDQIKGDLTTFVLSKGEIGCVYREYGFQDRVVQIYENSWKLDYSQYLNNNEIDFVIIDGCHDVEFVINDFLSVMLAISQDAIVLLHDIGLRSSDPQTYHLDDGYLACMYLRKMGYNIQQLQGTWWGIWRVQQPKTKLKPFIQLINRFDNLLRLPKRSIFSEARLFWHYLEQIGPKNH